MKTKYVAQMVIVLLMLSSTVIGGKIRVERGSDLQAVINYAKDNDTLFLAAKTFEAKPVSFIDPLCGNCLDPKTDVKASYGFIIKGKSLNLIGTDRAATKLVTNAGYGIYFENSPNSLIRNLTITGGKRDRDGNATDAAIVVRNTKLRVEQVDCRDNSDREDSVVVGIGGIFLREGADAVISECNIINNGWDGIALYRGATADVTDCLIKDGRGVGIGTTWDATCMAFRNEISGYWKGIGAFGTSWVVARNNIVHDNLGWGMVATGQSFMDITNNVIFHNGNCGVAPWSTDSRGRIINNIITDNGWRDQWVCPCVGVWNYGDWAKWRFTNNIVWNNKVGQYEGIWDQTDINGNLNKDPLFIGAGNFNLQPNSPAIHAGDSATYNTDGSISHIGITGGPQAREK
jgi:parallel beta-helix repeat protein